MLRDPGDWDSGCYSRETCDGMYIQYHISRAMATNLQTSMLSRVKNTSSSTAIGHLAAILGSHIL